MNVLGIDYGTKRIGIAVALEGVISPLTTLKNDSRLLDNLKTIISAHDIEKVYVGVSEGSFAQVTKAFVKQLSTVLQLPIETTEEAVSTIEADQIFVENRWKKKDYDRRIDSIAAAVILRRALNY